MAKNVSADSRELITLENYMNVDMFIESEEDHDLALQRLELMSKSDEILVELDKRLNNPVFQDATHKRDEIYALLDACDVEINQASGLAPNDERRKVKNFVAMRDTKKLYRDVWEKLNELNYHLNQYREVSAYYAEKFAITREAEQVERGEFLVYDKDTIGDLVEAGVYEIGSPEWHAQRSGGIGGSDVPKILKTDPKYGQSDYTQLFRTKLGLDVGNASEPYRDDYTTAIGRGNAWEEAIRHMYAINNPSVNVAFCKSSWEGRGDMNYVHANFDGLELDDDGNATGIIEIKTGVHMSKWGNTGDGYEDMPANYRQQAMWYALNAGLEDVILVALLDDYDYREYRFKMSDPRAVAETARIVEGTSEFWAKLLKELAEFGESGASLELNNALAMHNRVIIKGFPKGVNMKDVASRLAAYTGLSYEDLYDDVRNAFANKVRVDGYYPREVTQATLTSLYAMYDPTLRSKPFVGIDLETTHASPKKGRIIECGVVRLNNDGSTEIVLSSLHGVPEYSRKYTGTGLEEVHGITQDMIESKPCFENPAYQKELLALLKSGVIVAHNASFEREFLIANLDGFAEAMNKGEIQFLDTKQLASHLLVDTKDNSLESFAEFNGVPYVGAHAATVDTKMMMDALHVFRTNLHKNGVPTKVEISDEMRRQAVDETALLEANR